MLLFNYERIYILSYGNPKQMIKLFKGLVERPTEYKVLQGNSFILNPRIIYSHKHLGAKALSEYIGILSLRQYIDYATYGITSLQEEYIPKWIPKETVTNNPLIETFKQQLLFKYEE